MIVVCGLALVAISPGYNAYIVRSGSMSPSLNPGDLVVTGPVGGLLTREIQPGTMVTYQRANSIVTHRAISVDASTVLTKGDANEDTDASPVAISDVLGIYLFKVPFAGYLVAFTHSKLGWFLVILLPTAALLGLIIKDIIKEALTPDLPKASRR